MVFLRVTTLVLVVLFLMHAFRAFSSVYAHQDGDQILMAQSQEVRTSYLPMKPGLRGRKLGAEKQPENGIEKAPEKEDKRFSSAEKELANLLHKDYSNKNKPRRKPPIHNNQPRH